MQVNWDNFPCLKRLLKPETEKLLYDFITHVKVYKNYSKEGNKYFFIADRCGYLDRSEFCKIENLDIREQSSFGWHSLSDEIYISGLLYKTSKGILWYLETGDYISDISIKDIEYYMSMCGSEPVYNGGICVNQVLESVKEKKRYEDQNKNPNNYVSEKVYQRMCGICDLYICKSGTLTKYYITEPNISTSARVLVENLLELNSTSASSWLRPIEKKARLCGFIYLNTKRTKVNYLPINMPFESLSTYFCKYIEDILNNKDKMFKDSVEIGRFTGELLKPVGISKSDLHRSASVSYEGEEQDTTPVYLEGYENLGKLPKCNIELWGYLVNRTIIFSTKRGYNYLMFDEETRASSIQALCETLNTSPYDIEVISWREVKPDSSIHAMYIFIKEFPSPCYDVNKLTLNCAIKDINIKRIGSFIYTTTCNSSAKEWRPTNHTKRAQKMVSQLRREKDHAGEVYRMSIEQKNKIFEKLEHNEYQPTIENYKRWRNGDIILD